MSGTPKITKLPPGKALGADDLHEWASRRAVGQAGVYVSQDERKQQQIRTRTRSQYLSAAADQILRANPQRETKKERRIRVRLERAERERRERRAKWARRELRKLGVQP